jgi:uncharacterized sulfatase
MFSCNDTQIVVTPNPRLESLDPNYVAFEFGNLRIRVGRLIATPGLLERWDMLRSISFLIGWAIVLAGRTAGTETPPNIVVFISDDHSYLDSSAIAPSPDRSSEQGKLRCDVLTPHLERVFRDGKMFTRAFTVSPSCAPSRAALLTGLYPVQNGAMFNHQLPRPESKKLPAYLQELGYEVVAFGKVAHYSQVTQYGFDIAEHYNYHDDVCVTAAIDWLAQRRSEKPLCLMVGTNWPHVPWPKAVPGTDHSQYTLPETFIDTPQTRLFRERYYLAVRRMDEDLGLVYDAAYRTLGNNTLFIHFSDHGSQWPFAKWNLYDAGLHVPMVAVWPGVIEAGSRCDELMTLLDVLPTLIEAAGGAPSNELAGRSLVPLMTQSARQQRDEAAERDFAKREEVFATHSGDGSMNYYPMRAVRTKRWKYIRNLDATLEYATHIDRGQAADGANYWKSWEDRAKTDVSARAILERYHERPAEELYDLFADPLEQINLASQTEHAETLAQLRAELSAWMVKHVDLGIESDQAVRPRKSGNRP